MALNLASIVFESARNYPNQKAFACGVSYRSLINQVAKFGLELQRLGLRPGDRVALMCENRPEFTIAYFSILAIGAIVVPINVLLSRREVAYCLKHSKASLFIHSNSVAEVARDSVASVNVAPLLVGLPNIEKCCENLNATQFELFPTSPDDTAVIFYTSGTTGLPKGAELTHFNLFSNALWVSERSLKHPQKTPAHWGSEHCTLAVLALSHSFGQTCMQNAPLLNGGCISYMAKFDAQTMVQQMADHRVTILAAVPRMIKELLALEHVPEDLFQGFQYCLVGGAPIDQDVVQSFEKRFHVSVLEGYGLSETSPVIAFRTPEIPRKSGSVGRAIRGVNIQVVDKNGEVVQNGEIGEIVVNGQAVMKGYYQDPRETEATIKKGWLYTGDLGFQDEDGDVFLVDRKKDLIIRNGYNVYPAEVESVLCAFPGVVEAAVIGVDDEKCGQEIKAYIVGDFEVDALLHFCQQELAAYKYPRIVEKVAELPKGHKGQILRRKLKS